MTHVSNHLDFKAQYKIQKVVNYKTVRILKVQNLKWFHSQIHVNGTT